MFTHEENDMEEKNEQGPSVIEIAKPAPVPTLQELQNYILFLKSKIEQLGDEQARMQEKIYLLEMKNDRAGRPKDEGRK